MKSISVRICDHFKFCEPTPILVNGKKRGTILPGTPTSIIISNHSYDVYNAEFMEEINQSILVQSLDDSDTLTELDSYSIQQSLTMYYNSTTQKLLIDAPAPLAKSFLKALQDYMNEQGAQMNMEIIDFDFQILVELLDETRGITFNTHDADITKKRYSGPDVRNDQESTLAIDDDDATFVIGKMDVLNKSRTIGFSKSSTLVFYSGVKDIEKEHPYLELAVALLQKNITK